MSRTYPHTIRIYRGDALVGFFEMREDFAELFDQEVGTATFEPCFNLVDEFYPQSEKPAKYEYNKLMQVDMVFSGEKPANGEK